jgi:hypothetical protein
MSFQNKYFKYKNKYLNLKNIMKGGASASSANTALVMCQRKTTTTPSDIEYVDRARIKTEDFIHKYDSSITKIEYLSWIYDNDPNGFVDYNFRLGLEDVMLDNTDIHKSREFIDTHLKYYSLIILNICVYDMEYNVISQILKDDGRIIFTKFPTGLILQDNLETIIYNSQIKNNSTEENKLLNVFERVETQLTYDNQPIYYIYKKKNDL